MGQNLLLLPERSPDALSFSDGAQTLYGSSSPNSAVFHTLMYGETSAPVGIHSRSLASNVFHLCFKICTFPSHIKNQHFIPLQFQIQVFGS